MEEVGICTGLKKKLKNKKNKTEKQKKPTKKPNN